MSQLTDAADILLAHTTKLEAFKTAANALYGLDALATAEAEAKARIAAIDKQRAAGQQELEALNKELADHVASVAQARAQSAQEAQATLEATNAQAVAIVNDATVAAKAIVDKANTDAEDIKTQAASKASAFRQETADAEKATAAAKAELAEVQGHIETERAMLADLTAKIAAAQDKIKTMLA